MIFVICKEKFAYMHQLKQFFQKYRPKLAQLFKKLQNLHIYRKIDKIAHLNGPIEEKFALNLNQHFHN